MNRIIATYLQNQITNFFKDCANSYQTQLNLLIEILKKNQDTVFGITSNFRNIVNSNNIYQDFCNFTPIQTYENLEPYINRIAQGEWNTLTKENPIFFEEIYRHASKTKLIPATSDFIFHSKKLIYTWISSILWNSPRLLDLNGLILQNSILETHSNKGLPLRSLLNYIFQTLPKMIKKNYLIPEDILGFPDLELKNLWITRYALEKNIGFLITNNTEILLTLAKIAIEQKELFIQSIYDGSWPFEKNLQHPHFKMTPNRDRALYLEHLIKNESFLPKTFWPNLECIIIFSKHSETQKLIEFFGSIPILSFDDVSCEGILGFPVYNIESNQILAIQNNFYEFIPIKEYPVSRKTLLCHELEVGEKYFVIVTNHNGLYRYDIRKKIHVIDFQGETPIVHFM